MELELEAWRDALVQVPWISLAYCHPVLDYQWYLGCLIIDVSFPTQFLICMTEDAYRGVLLLSIIPLP